jgi:hypothetical protein
MGKKSQKKNRGTLRECVMVPITDPAEQAALDRRCREAEKILAIRGNSGKSESRKVMLDRSQPLCSSDRALQCARLDGEKAYGDLTLYRITVVLEADGWHIDYDLKDETLDGGGPRYVIDGASGDIISKRYEQ